MNDQTHDDSSFTLDKAIRFHRGWAIERQASGLFVWYPDDQDAVDRPCRAGQGLAWRGRAPQGMARHGKARQGVSLEAAREAIDAAIAGEEVSP